MRQWASMSGAYILSSVTRDYAIMSGTYILDVGPSAPSGAATAGIIGYATTEY